MNSDEERSAMVGIDPRVAAEIAKVQRQVDDALARLRIIELELDFNREHAGKEAP